jgi:hypothetical protein
LSNRIESQSGVKLSDDGTCLELADSVIYGYVILNPDTAEYPFNRGLPSWNGTAPDDNCSFLVQMRFPDGEGWSPWHLASGNYFIVMATPNFYKVMKAILVR